MNLLYVIFLMSYVVSCTSSEPAASPVNPRSTNTNNDDQNEPEDSTDKRSNDDETEDEVALISKSRAEGIMEASCSASDCHSDIDLLFEAESLIDHLEDETMPPPDQSRYTLSDQRRSELIKYFENQDE